MPINATLAQYSSWAFLSALVVYLLAMGFYIAEQAFGSRAAKPANTAKTANAAKARRRAPASARELASVSAGSGEVVGAGVLADDVDDDVDSDGPASDEPASDRTDEPADVDSADVDSTPTGDRRSRFERIGRMAVALTVLGALIQFASIALRGFATHRWPLGNMYEYISFITFVAVVCWLVAVGRFAVRRFGAWVLLPVLILMSLDASVFYTVAAPVSPPLQSYWLVIHVTIISASSGILLLPGVASIGYLIASANERNPKRFAALASRLPSAETLDRIAYRTTIFALPLFTFGIMCGAIWAESAWGSFWSWDPKETVALVDWVVYAAYLHSRATAGWRGQRSAMINALGFAVNVFNLFFINLVTTGLHSYAGLG